MSRLSTHLLAPTILLSPLPQAALFPILSMSIPLLKNKIERNWLQRKDQRQMTIYYNNLPIGDFKL